MQKTRLGHRPGRVLPCPIGSAMAKRVKTDQPLVQAAVLVV